MDLAERFNIPVKKEDHPTYLLFLQGQEEPIRYTGDETDADDIKKFVMKESGTISMKNCFPRKSFYFVPRSSDYEAYCLGLSVYPSVYSQTLTLQIFQST